MCCGPNDFDYPTFGGKHQRSNPTHGRVGSVFSDPGMFSLGSSADSNLGAPDDMMREAPDQLMNDDDLLEDLDNDLLDGNDMLDDLDRQLEELDKPEQAPVPDASEPDSDESTASRQWRQKHSRSGQRWR